MLPDELQHQQLVEIGIEQGSRDRIEFPVVVMRPRGRSSRSSGKVLFAANQNRSARNLSIINAQRLFPSSNLYPIEKDARHAWRYSLFIRYNCSQSFPHTYEQCSPIEMGVGRAGRPLCEVRSLPHCVSYGQEKVICFEPYGDGLHGNFHPSSYKASEPIRSGGGDSSRFTPRREDPCLCLIMDGGANWTRA